MHESRDETPLSADTEVPLTILELLLLDGASGNAARAEAMMSKSA